MPMVRALTWKLMVLASLLLLTACGTSSKYKVVKVDSTHPTIPMRVLVTELKDDRGFEMKTAQVKAAPPFSFFRHYQFSRPDEVYSSAIEPFPSLVARELADALSQSGQFERVQFARSDELPEPGSYDLLLKGTLIDTSAKGSVYLYGLALPFGFHFYDVVWFLGVPKLSRHYDITAEFQWYDGYHAGNSEYKIGKPIRTKFTTSSKLFTQYAEEGQMEDFKLKITPAFNDVITQSQSGLPSGDDTYWADLRTDGENYLAKLKREAEDIKKGALPTFSFLSPANGTIIRQSEAMVQWNASAPNNLQKLHVFVNQREVNTGIDAMTLVDERSAPQSISTRETAVKLDMGDNLLRAKIIDWRDNETNAELRIKRLPAELSPARRYAYLVGAGSSEASATVEALKGALVDPYVGQFEASSISTYTNSGTFDLKTFESDLDNFTRKPLAGDLAMICIAAPGDAATMSIGTGESQLAISSLLDMLSRSLATEDVLIILDLDWNASDTSKEILSSIENAPPRWALATSTTTPVPAMKSGGKQLYGMELIDSLNNKNRSVSKLTLERLFDELFEKVSDASNSKIEPDVTGRFNPNITMVTYE